MLLWASPEHRLLPTAASALSHLWRVFRGPATLRAEAEILAATPPHQYLLFAHLPGGEPSLAYKQEAQPFAPGLGLSPAYKQEAQPFAPGPGLSPAYKQEAQPFAPGP